MSCRRWCDGWEESEREPMSGVGEELVMMPVWCCLSCPVCPVRDKYKEMGSFVVGRECQTGRRACSKREKRRAAHQRRRAFLASSAPRAPCPFSHNAPEYSFCVPCSFLCSHLTCLSDKLILVDFSVLLVDDPPREHEAARGPSAAPPITGATPRNYIFTPLTERLHRYRF